MTAYNREKLIAEAIESVLASGYDDFELIIVDDCSTDNTVAIAQKYEEQDSRVKVFVNEKNLDQFPNRNKAAQYAKGDLLVFVDSDDTIKPDGLAYIVQQFERFPEAKFATIYGQPDINEATCMSAAESIQKHFFKSNHLHVGPGGTVIRKDFFKQIGGFPVAYGPAGDSYYNIKAASQSSVILLPYIYFNYRVHGNQELARKDVYLYYNYMYFRDMMQMPELPLTPKEKTKLMRRHQRQFLVNAMVHLKNTRNIGGIVEAFRKAGFGWREIVNGILG